jgi:hypothetical protein
MRPRRSSPPALVALIAALSATLAATWPQPARGACPHQLAPGRVAVLCDPGHRAGVRLVAAGYRGVRQGRRALLVGAGPLPVGRRVHLRRGRLGRRAQLLLAYAIGGDTVYVRFARFGPRRRPVGGSVVSRLTGRRIRARLALGARHYAPAAQWRSAAATPETAPLAPASATGPASRLPPQLIRCRNGSWAWALPDAVRDAQWRAVSGWTAGDGALSAPLPDGRLVWLFGDSLVGHDGGSALVRNSMLIEQGGSLGPARSGLAAALESGSADQWYWPQAAQAEGGELRAFFGRYRRVGPGAWDFAPVDMYLAKISLPDLTVRQLLRTYSDGPVAWGAALLDEGDWTYIYGVEDRGLEKYLHVARAPRAGLLGSWEFWSGLLGWGSTQTASVRDQAGVSNLLSVVKAGSGYLLITQQPLTERILAFSASAPTGPWSAPQIIYQTPTEGPRVSTYNAVAHPELTRDGRLLISYSVNGSNADAASPPRFFTVPLSCLTGR